MRTELACLGLALALHAALLPACVRYSPKSFEEIPFRERIVTEEQGGVIVSAAAFGRGEAKQAFGVPLGNKGIQPVFLEIVNTGDEEYLFFQQTVDPNYFAPLEAAYKSHYSSTTRFLTFGLVGIILWPLLLLAPIQAYTAHQANQKMNDRFVRAGIGNQLLLAGGDASGFVFTRLDEGTKEVKLQLLGPNGQQSFSMFVQVPGVHVDHERLGPDAPYEGEIPDLDFEDFRGLVEALPCCTTNQKADRLGDPLNLVIVADFQELLEGFTRAGWDETELIGMTSAGRTAKSFLLGSEYRYSPVSNLYLYGRQQDIAFQKARGSVHERNHLRLWRAPMRYEGKTVWVGQVSRDIGVKFTLRAWNLTTHVIDPSVDDSREAVMGDLLSSGRVKALAYLTGVPPSTEQEPSRNLMNDPYYTDGYRAVAILAGEEVERPELLAWEPEHVPPPPGLEESGASGEAAP